MAEQIQIEISPARKVLHEAIGKYKEKARNLKYLSIAITKLDEEDDGNIVVKRMTLYAVASAIYPDSSRSVWRRAEICLELVEMIQTVLDIGDATDEKMAFEIVKKSNLPAELLGDLIGLIG